MIIDHNILKDIINKNKTVSLAHHVHIKVINVDIVEDSIRVSYRITYESLQKIDGLAITTMFKTEFISIKEYNRCSKLNKLIG